jgi:hypothetical protein
MEGEPIEGRCNARTRSGGYCRNWPTRSNGKRCHFHGGAEGTGRPVIHGRYSKVLRESLREKYEEHLADDSYRELRAEIAIERALLSEYLAKLSQGRRLPPKHMSRLFSWLEAIGRMVERLARIESQRALTAREVQLLEATVVDLLGQYLPEEKREEFATKLASALGSDGIASLPGA